MNQNKSALDRLKEIEAEKKEIIDQLKLEKENSEFPIYVKHDRTLSKMFSKSKALDVVNGSNWKSVQSYDWDCSVLTEAWKEYMLGRAVIITPEEFEAARTEAINKLSAL